MIDRKRLVSRHNPRYTKAEKDAPLSVGNGTFCFTADVTGLQTFPEHYADFPLCTMANWGWHSYCTADLSALRLTPYDTFGRQVGYATDDTGQEELFKALRQNAHKFHLGSIGFELPVKASGIMACTLEEQRLSLWEGILSSVFVCAGALVSVETLVHPTEDTLCIRIVSLLLKTGTLGVRLSFPYGSHKKTGADFSVPDLHTTAFIEKNAAGIVLRRTLDTTVYQVHIALGKGVSAAFDEPHTLRFTGTFDVMELSIRFVPVSIPTVPSETLPAHAGVPPVFAEARAACVSFWERYWNEGAALDLSASRDGRALELERRVVLSQYLTAIQSRGTIPPAETGLTCNSWYGKFHLEMHYWHVAHFALWGRAQELRKSLDYYRRILPLSRELAASQGYRGVRWPKMCDPSGYNSPSSIAVLLVWQQPHPIFLAELCYRANPDPAFLQEYRDVVVESAEFIQSFVHQDGNRFVLGPPLMPAQERHDPRIVLNPAYEVAYFRWALVQATIWLKRLGEAPRRDFTEAAERLAPPAVKDGCYLAHENCPDTFTSAPFYTDHPSMLAILGMLPGAGINPAVMSATLDQVLQCWDRESLWGWDFPMMAMTACRLGRREDAVRLLLLESPKNTYRGNGHNAQVGSADLPLYLPGNGGLLLATAMMAEGFDGDDGSGAPGFPDDGSFTVQGEGFVQKYI
ncbi:MAG: hypothetical protein LBU17_02715 [Treponema sp.]|nr:hypothetical protein [Treponema sp.]